MQGAIDADEEGLLHRHRRHPRLGALALHLFNGSSATPFTGADHAYGLWAGYFAVDNTAEDGCRRQPVTLTSLGKYAVPTRPAATP